MERDLANRLSCVVCGIETKRHAGWFLVMDDGWLDRVKIFCWHPVLAREGRMRAVCGQPHLKALLSHWLTYANLELVASGAAAWPTALDASQKGRDYSAFALGKVVGELAVHREELSHTWTGSPEAMECILNALIGGTEPQPRGPEPRVPERSAGYAREYAFY